MQEDAPPLKIRYVRIDSLPASLPDAIKLLIPLRYESSLRYGGYTDGEQGAQGFLTGSGRRSSGSNRPRLWNRFFLFLLDQVRT